MFTVSRKDMYLMSTRSREDFDLFLALEVAAVVQDMNGTKYIAIRQSPKQNKSVCLFAHVDVDMPRPVTDLVHAALPSNGFLFWKDAKENTLGVVSIISLEELISKYSLVEEIKDEPVRYTDIAKYERVESLPLGLKQKIYDRNERKEINFDQHLDVVKCGHQVVVYLHHNYNGKQLFLDLSEDPAIYSDFRESVLQHLPRLMLGYNLSGGQGRLSQQLSESRIKVMVAPKNIPVTRGHNTFRFQCASTLTENIHVSFSWK